MERDGNLYFYKETYKLPKTKIKIIFYFSDYAPLEEPKCYL